ncbi:zf-HC2 domain-containing protein [candidate division KSB1 bacterium]|nr:zf-HC2 domain-containing protein [candidate division KSB1 bacterium]
MDCKKIKINISAMLDKELDEQEKQLTLSHIKICSYCRDFYEKSLHLQEVIAEKLYTPRVPNSVRTGLYRRLENQKRSFNLDDLWLWMTGNKWALRMELALVFGVAVLIGLNIRLPNFSGPADISQPPFSQNVDKYLEKSTKMLLELKNSEMDPSKLDYEKQLAKQLLVESKLVTQNLENNRTQIHRLVNELEPVLWDVANLNDPHALQIIQQTIDDRDYLLKLDFARKNIISQARAVK